MSEVRYGCAALVGTNKKGTLKKDEKGYYQVVLGALNYYNQSGAFYPLGPAKALFDKSSHLMRRIEQGNLHGEAGHPRMTPGMSKRDFFVRVADVVESNMSHHIREVWLDDTSSKDRNGKPIVLIMGWIRPTATPMGLALKDALENSDQNVCFSGRYVTTDFVDAAGNRDKNIKECFTWDWVMEPGIKIATKYDTPTMESLDIELDVTPNQLLLAKNLLTANGVSMESDSARNIDNLIHTLGWDHYKGPTERTTKINRPASSRW